MALIGYTDPFAQFAGNGGGSSPYYDQLQQQQQQTQQSQQTQQPQQDTTVSYPAPTAGQSPTFNFPLLGERNILPIFNPNGTKYGSGSYSSIVPGDVYTPAPLPTVDPNGEMPWSENYPGKPTNGFLYGTSAQPGQLKDYAGSIQQSSGAVGSVGEFNKDKYVLVKSPSGLDAYVPKPPTTYDEAGGYDAFINKWKEWYENVRKVLGLGDTWSQDDIDKLKSIFESMGIKFQAKPGEKWSSRIYIPDGKGGYIQIDTRGGAGQSGWVNYGHTDQSGAFSGNPGNNSNAAAPPSATSNTSTSGTSFQDFLKSLGLNFDVLGGTWGNNANDFYKLLMDRINQSLNINRQDPIIRNQSDAFAAAQARALRDYINDTAERTGAFANIDAERRSGAEKVGQNTSAFEAQLMGSELKARRDEIAQAISQMGNLIPEEQRLGLQQYLGLIDAALRKLGLDQDQDQFLRRLGFDTEDRATYYDLIRRGLL